MCVHVCEEQAGGVGEGVREGPSPLGPQTLTVVRVDYLEVLDGGLGDAALEVEGVGAAVLVPHGRLVVQLDEALERLVLPTHKQPVAGLQRERAVRATGTAWGAVLVPRVPESSLAWG